MALQKTINLPNGAGGDYIQVGPYYSDRLTKTASADLLLYVSAARAASNPESPLCVIGRLVLSGAIWDTYLSTPALQALAELGHAGPDPTRHQLYAAVKAGEPLRAGGGLRQDELDLTDALDV
jgi:hypothetical protein